MLRELPSVSPGRTKSNKRHIRWRLIGSLLQLLQPLLAGHQKAKNKRFWHQRETRCHLPLLLRQRIAWKLELTQLRKLLWEGFDGQKWCKSEHSLVCQTSKLSRVHAFSFWSANVWSWATAVSNGIAIWPPCVRNWNWRRSPISWGRLLRMPWWPLLKRKSWSSNADWSRQWEWS